MTQESKRIHVVFVSLAYARGEFSTPVDLLNRYFLNTGWTEAVRRVGAQVTVLHRFDQNAIVERNNVRYYFVKDQYDSILDWWQVPWRLLRQVRTICVESLKQGQNAIVHFHGLLFPLQIKILRMLLPQHLPIVVQHHAETPWPMPKRVIQSWGVRNLDGFFFTNQELAQPWLSAGILPSQHKIYALMEGSSILTYQDRATARKQTGMTGNPVVLWTGRLISVKAPLTVLAGFEQVLAHVPDARLYMAYSSGDMVEFIKEMVNQNPVLRPAVTFLGTIPYTEIEPYYNSADIFVQGSRSEGSGIALLDALACGVVPVVTDIPSFRTITNDGTIGALWTVDDVDAFEDAFVKVWTQSLTEQSEKAQRYFQSRWSFSVIGQKAAKIYEQILRSQQS
ncbi:glycosyltransferase family 4 protein [Chloroflexi bacterium TSY]|nr:glycosyltransferase family 4 protein [Chloroflexi bacterium TSY]